MAIDSLKAIENAEIEAEKMISEAAVKKVAAIKAAQESAAEKMLKEINNAEKKADEIIESAKNESKTQMQSAGTGFEKELEEIKLEARQKQNKAVEEVLKILPALL